MIQGLLPRFKGLLPGLKDYFQDSRTSSRFKDFFQDSRISSKIQGSSSRTQGLLPRFKDFFKIRRLFKIQGFLPRFKDFFQDSRVFFQDSSPSKVANVSKIQIPKKNLQMFNLLPFCSSKHNFFFFSPAIMQQAEHRHMPAPNITETHRRAQRHKHRTEL